MSTSSSVIVVSYRPGSWLEPCLRSVVDQAGEVIAVDNGSAASTASDIARSCRVRTVRSPRNLGFAGGVALGLSAAQGEVIGLLNDDAVAAPNWLSSASAVLDDPSVAAVTPKVLIEGPHAEIVLEDEVWFAPGDARPLGRQVRSITAGGREVLATALGAGLHPVEGAPGDQWRWTAGAKPFYVPLGPDPAAPVRVDGVPVPSRAVVRVLNHAGSFLRGHGIAGEYGLGAPDDGRFDRPREPFGFSGTAPVFRTDTLRRLGSFAPEFFAYNEDTDWCLRARLAGLRIAYDPLTVVTHRLSATSGGTVEPQVQRLSQRNALLCLLRNAPWPVARRHVAERLGRGPGDFVARQVAARLPWALSSRIALSRRWVYDPADVWFAWADRDTGWDASPTSAGPSPPSAP